MAEQTANMVSDFRIQFQNFFQALTAGKKIFLFSSIAVVLVGLISFVYFSQQETWATLSKGLTQKEAAVITKKLEESQIPYRTTNGLSEILVPIQHLDKVKLDIAGSGLRIDGSIGLEIFDKNTIGATEFQLQVQYKRALEGELKRLIEKIQNIKSAKISLALPKKSLFISQEQKPTAAVLLELEGSLRRLPKKQVNAIVHLVAGSIPNMEITGVRISDQYGNLLSKGVGGLDLNEIIDQNFRHKAQIERRLEMKILNQLESITGGKDRVKVNVAAKVNFDTSEISENIVDPDGSAIISQKITQNKSTGSRSIPVGVPGVTTNSPARKAGASEIANVSESNQKTKQTNYELSKKHIKRKKASGTVERLSVSVLIDGTYKIARDKEQNVKGIPTYEKRSLDELKEIQEVVQTAIGYSAKRGDVVTVKNVRFAKPLFEQEQLQIQKREATRKFITDVLKYGLFGVALILVVLMVIRPMVQRLSMKPEDLDLIMGLPTTIGELEGEELEIPTEKDVGIPPRDKILEIARQDPLKTASQVRTWLRDKKGQS